MNIINYFNLSSPSIKKGQFNTARFLLFSCILLSFLSYVAALIMFKEGIFGAVFWGFCAMAGAGIVGITSIAIITFKFGKK